MPKFLTFFHIFTCRFTFFYKSFNYLLCVFGDIRKISAKAQIFSSKNGAPTRCAKPPFLILFCRSHQQRHFFTASLLFWCLCRKFEIFFDKNISFPQKYLDFFDKMWYNDYTIIKQLSAISVSNARSCFFYPLPQKTLTFWSESIIYFWIINLT